MRYKDEDQETFGISVCGFGKNRAHCVYLNNFRIVGGKPWGGGDITASWRFTLEDLQSALPELDIKLKEATTHE